MTYFKNALLVAGFTLGACTTTPIEQDKTAAISTEPAIAEISQANNAFAVDLYEMVSNGDGNVFISPASISTALGLAYAGARGTTAAEMENVLHFNPEKYAVHASLGKLLADLQIDEPGRTVSINNAIWVDHETVVEPDYSELIEKHYGARENRVDFRTSEASREKARKVINGWVEEKTKDRIKDLLQPDDFNEKTRMSLVNTIYLKADWARQFTKEATQDRPFTLSSGQSIQIPTMAQQNVFRYLDGSGFQALELPYVNNEYSMLVFLPDEGSNLAKFENKLSEKRLAKWGIQVSGADPREVILHLPKIKLTQRFILSDTLADMGMPCASLDTCADFDDMIDPSKQPPEDSLGVGIGTVVHKTFLEVDEKGTEAAAATSVNMIALTSGRIGPPPILFHVNRPYFIILRHNETGAILFMGRISDPR